MATYSNNTTISISAAVSTGVSYTVPANSYLQFQAHVSSSPASVNIGGQTIRVDPTQGNNTNLVVGPGVTIDNFSNVSRITGVLFTNTP